MHKLFVVIPVHNRIKFTRDCLKSLQNQVWKGFQTIVIDDGSTDGTSEMVLAEYPEAFLLKGDGNLWWSGATNLGVKYSLEAGANHILTLNDDTIAPPDFMQMMMKWATKKPLALFGALALDTESGKPVYGGEVIDWQGVKSTLLLDFLSPEERTGIHRVTHFPGRGLLIPSAVFKKIGFYDAKNFPQTAADYDFTLRAGRAGFEIYCNYDSPLYTYPHESGGSAYRINKSFRNYYSHLFDIKGGGNLRFFTLFCFKNCPKRYMPYFLLKGSLQRIFGYWR